MKTYRKGDVPPTDDFALYRKKHLTQAVRIEGRFRVETDEGPLECGDGYLALDSRGYPYPIDAEEFAAIYEPA